MLYCQESTVIGFKVSDKGPTVVLSVLWAPQVLKGPGVYSRAEVWSFKKYEEVFQGGQFMRVTKCQVTRSEPAPI